ncbi:MAG TPA: glycosyltransferase [Bryobacteraceae bacterium]|nr:glycosyltransferase [Bryobacteraceae bacterium]
MTASKTEALVAVLIPAFKPSESLVLLVDALVRTELCAVVVVDDGSGPEFADVFQAVALRGKVHVLRHAVNLGKGAALKTGINYVHCTFADYVGIVTADADGQHLPEDILAVARRLVESPDAMVLGCRQFHAGVPLRSRAGNILTKLLVRVLVGRGMSDTQTGLRGVPSRLAPELLRIPSTGYEYELEMLIACRHRRCRVLEEPIQTVYIDGNKSSHFHPIRDSMRIYAVLLRFTGLSLLTAAVDNAVFFVTYLFMGQILTAQALARALAVLLNYSAARRAVFLSDQSHVVTLPKYLLLVVASGSVAYGMITFMSTTFHVPVMIAKIVSESLLFIANFAIQRDFIFVKRELPGTAEAGPCATSSPRRAGRS